MIDFFLINKILMLIVASLGMWLGLFVYFSNKNSRINQLFLLMMLLALSWVALCYFSGILVDNLKLSLLLARLAYGIAILFFIPFFYFFSFLIQKKSAQFLNFFIPSVSILIFFLSTFTDFMAIKMTPIRITGVNIGVVPIIGYGKFFYFGLVFFVSILVITKILKKYFTVPRNEKLKLQYFLFGILIFVISNLIFNVVLTFSTGDARYYQAGNYSIIFLLAFTAYAIIKRKLFDIKVALTSVFVGLISLLLFLDTLLFTEDLWIQVTKGIILAMFLVFGWTLIRSVMREIKQRERLAEAYVKLQQLDKAKTEFLSIASHQLRTPLTAIKGYISMMLEEIYGKPPEKMVKPLESIYASNERLIKLVNDLLNISRIETGRVEVNMENLSLEELVEEAIEEMKPVAEKRGLYLKLEKFAGDLPKTSLDKEKIRQVITNILDNALKYTEEGGIAVGLQKTDHNLQISISDTGDGLGEEEITHLFTSFTRGKAGTRLWVEGAGLGLYIAKKFMELHNGKIWAESKGKGRGSTFHIELPIKSSEETLIKKL